MTREEIEILVRMSDNVSKIVDMMAANMKGAGTETERLNQKINTVIKSAENLGHAMAGAFAFRAALRQTVGEFGQFERATVAVAKTADLNNAQLKEFRAEIQQLGSEIKGVSLDNLLEVAEVAGQMGIKGAKNLARFTEVMAQLQTAAPSVQGDRGAQIVARILKLTKEGVEGVERFSDVLVELGNNSAAFEMEILEAAGAVSQSAAAFNLSSAAILGMATAAKELNFRDEIFGAAVARTLVQLQEAALQGSKGMKVLSEATGITQEQFRNLLNEKPEQAIIEFLKVLRSIPNDASRLSFLELFNLQAEENQRVMGAAAQNIETFAGQIARAEAEAAKGGARLKEYNRGADTQSATLAQLSNNWDLFGQAVGAALEPITDLALGAAISSLQALTETFKSLPEWAQTATAAIVLLGLAAYPLIKAFALLRVGIGALKLGSLAGSLGAASGAAGLATTALTTLWGAFKLFSGIGIVVAGVAMFKDELTALKDVMMDWTVPGWLLGGSDGAFNDFLNSNPFTGVIQSGKNAGKNFWTGVREYTQNEKGEWVKVGLDGMTDEMRKRTTEAYQQYAKSRVEGEKMAADAAAKAAREAGGPDPYGVRNAPNLLTKEQKQALAELDPYTQNQEAIQKYEQALERLKKISEGATPSDGNDAATADTIARYEKLLEVQRRMADPVAQRLRDLQDETATANAYTGQMRNALELANALRDATEERGILTKEQTEELTRQVRELQKARTAAAIANKDFEYTQQLAAGQQMTTLARARLEVEQEIARAIREQGELTDEQRAVYEKLYQIKVQDAQNSLRNSLDPIRAANLEYQSQLEILRSMNLEAAEFARLKSQLDFNTRDSRDPVGERVRQMREEIDLMRMSGPERDRERAALQEIDALRRQGVTVTKEMEAAIRAYTAAMQEADAATKNGLAAWAEGIGEFKDNLASLQEEAVGGFADALVDALTGKAGSFTEFGRQIGKQMVSFAVKQFMADGIRMFNIGNKAKDMALDKASAAASQIEALKANQMIQAGMATVNANVVNVGGAPLSDMTKAVTNAGQNVATATESVTSTATKAATEAASGAWQYPTDLGVEKIVRQPLADLGTQTAAMTKTVQAANDNLIDMGNGIKMTQDAFDYKQFMTNAEGWNLRGGLGANAVPQIDTAALTKSISLSPQEIVDLKKTVATEWVQSAGDMQGKGIIDTILNRKASGKWGDSITDVVNAKSQFSDINGRPAWLKGRNSVDDLPMSRIDARTNALVDDWLKQRASGAESTVGSHLNYANPNFSDAKNLGWINNLEGPTFGRGNAIHKHGTTPDLQRFRPEDYGINLPGMDGSNPAAALPMSNKQAMEFVGNYKAGVDQRLTDILEQSSKKFEAATGMDVRASSGFRPGDPRFHGKGMATDVQLWKDGKLLDNYQNADTFKQYEMFAQQVKRDQMEMFPELNQDLRWGGYFSGGKGKYGAMDPMHFDLGGRRVGMAGGSWEQGLTGDMRAKWPGAESMGMGQGLQGGWMPGGYGSTVDMMSTGSIPGMGMGAGMPQVQQLANQFSTTMKTSIGQVGAAFPPAFTDPLAQVGQNFQSTFSQAGTAFQQLGPQIQSMGQNVMQAVPPLGSFGQGISGLMGPLAQAPQMTAQFSQQLMQMMQQMAMQKGMGLLGGLFHGGGTVGGPPTGGWRMVSPGAFSGAKRYHSGLKNDEFAAILQRGERVLTRKQHSEATAIMEQLTAEVARKNLGAANSPSNGGNSGGFQQNITVFAKDADSFKRTEGQIMADSSIQMRRMGSRNT